MNNRDKEVYDGLLGREDQVLRDLKKQYERALRDIDAKIRMLQSDELTQSRIYQINYQKALKGQVESIIDKLHGDEYSTIQKYLTDSYTDAYVGTMYAMSGSGVHIIQPIDRNAAVKAVITDSELSVPLYASLGYDMDKMKKHIREEITRGIATSLPYDQIANNISGYLSLPLANAKRIVRTEGHRIQQESADDARNVAKSKGADVVKQWDASLDGATRPLHRELDGQIRETDEPFEAGGKKVMYPGKFGDPSQDCNCRCVALTRARWALDESELETLKERAKFFGIDKTDNFEDYKKKYLKAAEEQAETEKTIEQKKQNVKASAQEKPNEQKKISIEQENSRGTDAIMDTYEKRMKETGVKLVSAEELRGTQLVDFSGIDERSAAASNQVIEKYAGRYNSWIAGIHTTDALTEGAAGYTEISAPGGTGSVTLNAKMMKNYDKMVASVKENGNTGHGVKVKPEYYDQYIMTHEFGHTLLQKDMKQKSMVGVDHTVYKKALKEAEAVYSAYKKDYHDLSKRVIDLKKQEIKINDMFMDDDADILGLMKLGKKVSDEMKKAEEELESITISRYANTDLDEFIAEAWTEREIGENPGKYSKEIGDIIDKYFKY